MKSDLDKYDNNSRVDVTSMTHEQLLEHVRKQNYVIAALAGRLDVVRTYVDKQAANGRPVMHEFQSYIVRTNDSVDRMLNALTRGEPVV